MKTVGYQPWATIAASLSGVRKVASSLRYVSLLTIFLRLRRKGRVRRVLSDPASYAAQPISDSDYAVFVAGLTTLGFRVAADRIREITHSSFSYDGATRVLTFRKTGDEIRPDDIPTIPWATPGAIPACDLNRCYFMSFLEQATLWNGTALEGLEQLEQYARLIDAHAPLGGSQLLIPWQPMCIARRLINTLGGLSLCLAKNPTLIDHPATRQLAARARALMKLLISLREDDLGYNHLAIAIFAQCLYSALDPDFGAPEAFGAEFLRTISDQVGADGMQLERTATYQAHVLGCVDTLVVAAILPEALQRQLTGIAARMRHALALLTHPDGDISVFNDAAIGDGPTPAVLGAFTQVIGQGIHRLDHAGYARIESGPFVAIFDAGDCGPDDNPGHAHADFLSFELSVMSRRLFVDPGVASYMQSPERDRCRSSAIHNGPAFEGLEPIEFTGPFRVGRRGHGRFTTPDPRDNPEVLSVAGCQTGFKRLGAEVFRQIDVDSKGSLQVTDIWRGLSDHNAQSLFLVPPDWAFEWQADNRVMLSHHADPIRIILWAVTGTLNPGAPLTYNPVGPRRTLTGTTFVLTPISGAPNTRNATFKLELA